MKKSKVLMLVIAVMMAFSTFTTVLNAATPVVDTSKTGSLTITAREQNDGSTAKDVALKGVEYTLYKVDDYDGTTVTTVAQAETAIASLTAVGTQTTGEDGVAKFESLALGRYYAKVTNVPAGTSQTPESFLVNIPMTNTDGTDWIYDVTVEPKVQTATSTVTVTKTNKAGTALQGASFKVQVSTDDGSTWADYKPEDATEVLTATTGSDGTITLENLPTTVDNGKTAKYRLIETAAPDTKYIVDNAHPTMIKVSTTGTATISEWDYTTSKYVDTEKTTTTIKNEETEVVKTVNGKETDNVSRNDTLKYSLTVDIPENIADLTTFKVVDTADAGITVDTSTVKVQTLDNGTSTDLSVTPTVSGQTMTFTLTPSTLAGKDTVVITYDAKVNENADKTATGNTNTATLTYTNSVDVDGTEKGTTTSTDSTIVTTGGFKISKVDVNDAKLAGATFVLEDSDGNRVQKDGEDYTVTSDSNGAAEFTNLKDGTYTLIETVSPTYEETEDGTTVTKHYQLLGKGITVTVSSTSYNGKAIKVVNKKEFELPLTGGIGAILFVLVGGTLIIASRIIKKREVRE